MTLSVTKLASVDNTTLEQRIAKYAEAYANGARKSEAYSLAGYKSATPGNAADFHNRHYKAIHKELAKCIASNVPLALQTLKDVMVNGRSETARVKAALEVLDRGGFDKQTRIQIGSETPKTQEELEEELKALLANNAGELRFLTQS